MVVDFVPVIAVALIIFFAVQPTDDAEVVCNGPVGVDLLNLVIAGQVGMGIAFGFEDLDFALRSKYILHVSVSFR